MVLTVIPLAVCIQIIFTKHLVQQEHSVSKCSDAITIIWKPVLTDLVLSARGSSVYPMGTQIVRGMLCEKWPYQNCRSKSSWAGRSPVDVPFCPSPPLYSCKPVLHVVNLQTKGGTAGEAGNPASSPPPLPGRKSLGRGHHFQHHLPATILLHREPGQGKVRTTTKQEWGLPSPA